MKGGDVSEWLDALVGRAEAGEAVAVCALAKTTGSTPQKAGAMMLVLMDGRSLGTIGGGCIEAEVRSEALRRLSAPRERRAADGLLRFSLDRDYGWDDGLVCGGVMFVAVQVVDSPEAAAPWRAARASRAAGQTARVALALMDDTGSAVSLTFEQEPSPRLVIAGAGHVGSALAKVAGPLGFSVTVVDDRADAASAAWFPDAERVVGPIDLELGKMRLDERSYVVIVTRGHRHDGDALAAVVDSGARYVGLIGSRRKTLAIFERLLAQGVSAERLAAVRSPIGLKIGAVSPAEIAVSIAAELIACRRGESLEQSAVMGLAKRDVERLARRAGRDGSG